MVFYKHRRSITQPLDVSGQPEQVWEGDGFLNALARIPANKVMVPALICDQEQVLSLRPSTGGEASEGNGC